LLPSRPTPSHTYGHDKAEYFAGGVVGTLVVVAALTIGVTAVRSLFDPQPIEQIGLGLAISLLAALCNLITARILIRAGEQHDSMTLMADGRHLMADVWTSGAL
jgi:cation diffusion facilitator family transporter